jgi:hypothetical protein
MRYFVCCDLESYYVTDDTTNDTVAGPFAESWVAALVCKNLNEEDILGENFY